MNKIKYLALTFLFIFICQNFSIQAQTINSNLFIAPTNAPNFIVVTTVPYPQPTFSSTPIGNSPSPYIFPSGAPTYIPVTIIPGQQLELGLTPIMETPYPTPTISVTILPSPTQIPIPPFSLNNHLPELITDSLHKGKFFTPYITHITGEDLDLNDTLSMKISGLPRGLMSGDCRTKIKNRRQQITCKIYGIPFKSGKYFINVELNDGRIGLLRRLPLVIK